MTILHINLVILTSRKRVWEKEVSIPGSVVSKMALTPLYRSNCHLNMRQRKYGRKYTSHEMQNEMLKVKALQIL